MQDRYFGNGPSTYGGGLLLLTFIFYLLFYWIVIAGTATHSVAIKARKLLSHPAVWAVVAGKKPKNPPCQTDPGFSVVFKWRVTVIWQIYQSFSWGSYPICSSSSISTLPQHLTHPSYEIHAWVEAGGTHTRKAETQSQPEHSIWFSTYDKVGGRLLRAETTPRLRVPALLGCLMKAIPAPVRTTAALLGLLKLSRFCPGACVRLAHGGPHRSL